MDRKAHKIIIETPDPGYEPFPVSIMNRSTHEINSFDPTLGKPATISYRLNKAGCIRIRLALRDQPETVILTLQDWTDQEFGNYELSWDGHDSCGTMVDNTRILVLFEAKDKEKGLQHKNHDSQKCRDLSLTIKSVTNSQEKENRIEKIMVSATDGQPSYGESNGCQVNCYIDYKLHKTEIIAGLFKEFVLKVDTSSLTKGEHLISFNINDYNDHIGAGSIKIQVEN